MRKRDRLPEQEPVLMPEDPGWLATHLWFVYAAWALSRALMLWAAVYARPDGDVSIYFQYAGNILGNQVPYRDFTLEYPPGVLPFIIIPRLFAGSLLGYRASFGVAMLLADFLCFSMLHSSLKKTVSDASPRHAALLLYVVLTAVLFSLPYGRFDLVPMVCTLACLWFWREKRLLPAWICLGIGFSIKLYPVVLLPVLGIVSLRHHSLRKLAAGVAAFAATVALLWMPFVAASGSKFWVFISYHAQRWIQLESLYANLVALARPFGYSVGTVYSYGSVNIVAGIGPVLAKLSLVAGALIQGSVLYHAWRVCRRPEWTEDDLARLFLLALLGFILAGKVISPQYMLWIAPFIVLVCFAGRRPVQIISLAAGIFGLTVLVYPFFYDELMQFSAMPWLLLTARNGLLVLLFVVVLGSGGPGWKERRLPAGKKT